MRTPNDVYLGGGAFGHEGGVFMKRIGALLRDSRELPRPFYHARTQEGTRYEPGSGPSPATILKMLGPDLELPAFKTMRNRGA